jgi:hypothetical protein
MTSLGSKMSFYLEHFLELQDGIIIHPPYTYRHWMHSLRIPLGQLGLVLIEFEWRLITISHVLIGFARCVTYRSQRQRDTSFFGALCTMRLEDVTTASTGTQGCSLSTFFRYQDQRCLAFFIREILSHKSQLLHPPHPGKD